MYDLRPVEAAIVMAVLWNRAGHYFLPCGFFFFFYLLLLFFLA